MPRGPGKAANYNLSYSRFNGVGDDEDAAPEPVAAPEPEADEGVADMREMLRNMPGELQEAYRLMMISRESGDKAAEERANELALRAVKRGSPEVQQQFVNELSKKAPEAAQALGQELKVDVPGAKDPGSVGSKIDTLRTQMEEGAKATRNQMEMLQKQQEQLEGLQSPEDFIKFFKEGGMEDMDLQRIMTGDQAHMEKCVSGLLDKAAGTTKLEDVESQVKAAETLHRTIVKGENPEDLPDRVDEEPKAAAPPAEAPKEKRKEPAEPPCHIPDHRLQYHKDESGKYSTVELKCSLPGIKEIGAIALDVNEKYLRLSTQVPKYAVNAGPFPVLIEPGAAKAKFSKKREELSIVVPAKA